MKKLGILAALLAALQGCNTMAGVGQDITGGANRVGDWVGGPNQSTAGQGYANQGYANQGYANQGYAGRAY